MDDWMVTETSILLILLKRCKGWSRIMFVSQDGKAGEGHVVRREWRPESKYQLVGTKPNSWEGNSSSEW